MPAISQVVGELDFNQVLLLKKRGKLFLKGLPWLVTEE